MLIEHLSLNIFNNNDQHNKKYYLILVAVNTLVKDSFNDIENDYEKSSLIRENNSPCFFFSCAFLFALSVYSNEHPYRHL